ncbi:MAG: acyltransferase family protein [Cyclobacteriaceae bacterium]|nr:acyltransferase family protein [Cyclobacteriaceae bacterium]
MRRHNIDWLRVIVFGLLIFYHVGMFFVPWGFHIKNNIIYPDIRWPMLFLNQWRLPLLFVISGMGTWFALSKRSGWQFIRERTIRLFIPLIVGILFIVPPQVYFERMANGRFEGSFMDYWPTHAFAGVYPHGNLSWHHLWFLPYLLVFSLTLLPVFLYLRKLPQAAWLNRLRKFTATPFGLFWFIVPLYFWEALLEPFFPSTHALMGDWFNLVNFATFFFYGFLLISTGDDFWRTIQKHRRKYLYCGLVGFGLLLGIRALFEDSIPVHFIEALFKVFNLWSWILSLMGYTAVYLNKPSAPLAYANEAVYPFYILHQTIIIAIGYYLMDLNWNFWPKLLLMVFGTFAGSWLIYEFAIRRWRLIRPLFGLTVKKQQQNGKLE